MLERPGRTARESRLFDFRKRWSLSPRAAVYYAAQVGKYWFERFAWLPVEVEVASEFRYRNAPYENGNLAMFVSQSGETADTLATLRRREGGRSARPVDRQRADLDHRSRERRRAADAGRSGNRGGVNQSFHLPAGGARLSRDRCRARAGGAHEDDEHKLFRALVEVPRLMAEALALEPTIERLARDLARSQDVLYLGRGTSYPLALEGALKLKEISYIHAEGYAAGELNMGRSR